MDENKILELLASPVTTPMAPRLNAGALMAVVAAFDRKIDREAFQEVLNKAVDLQRMVVRLQTLDLVTRYMVNNNLETEMEKNAAYCTEQGEACRKMLHHSMNLIAQCPWEGDTLH